MKNQLKILLPSMAVMLLSIGTASAVSYTPQFQHSGTMCRPHSSSGTPIYYNQGALSNGHWTQTLHVFCPVVRENDFDRLGKMIVHVVDRNQGKGVKCSWYDVEAYGRSGRWWWSGWKTSLGSGVNNVRTMSWSRNAVYDKFEGYSHMLCQIPPRHSIGRSLLGSYGVGQ